MGIPSYFAYIIKNHASVLRSLEQSRRQGNVQFSSFYMDCNSIVYDAVRACEGSPQESRIIAFVIQSIANYIRLVAPTKLVYIAFDGVAPLAKMEQQRVRRYKTAFLNSIDFASNASDTATKTKLKFDTTTITPGTPFMEKLTRAIHREFDESASRFGCSEVVVSCSDEQGEGEHKMFAYLREHGTIDETVCVYGLDADLIMLSLFHVFSFENVFIMREQPEFAKSIFQTSLHAYDTNDDLVSSGYLLLDCRALGKAIVNEMGLRKGLSPNELRGRIYDYIFMCFLLGNDFMPHFPALSIRTHGIYTLMEVYSREISCKDNRFFIDLGTGKIQWKWVKLLLFELAGKERQFLVQEEIARNKMEERGFSVKTAADRENVLNHAPLILRGKERYVCPSLDGWEIRYYQSAFNLGFKTVEEGFVRGVCENYFEGLEWVLKYYTSGCPHWRWRYKYNYAPLLMDLCKHIPSKREELITEMLCGANRAYSAKEQLSYVMPKECMLESMEWMYCKYMWESKLIEGRASFVNVNKNSF